MNAFCLKSRRSAEGCLHKDLSNASAFVWYLRRIPSNNAKSSLLHHNCGSLGGILKTVGVVSFLCEYFDS